MNTQELKKMLGSEKLIFGGEESLKTLRKGGLSSIIFSQNPKPELKKDIEKYAEISSVTIEILDVPNDELGTICKKPFPISTIGIRK